MNTAGTVKAKISTVLGNLRVGDAFHAAKYRVEENDRHDNEHPGFYVDFEKARKDDAGPLHLTADIHEGNNDCTKHGNQPR